MAGSVAATIQGEAGSNPANQFAVASTIWNRLKAGTYGGSAAAIVNAPNQFVGSAVPNSSAQTFAQAIENGTLPQFGNPGNAVNFQTAGSNTTLGRDPAAVNIGGNAFSNRFGTPTADFVPPQYGASAFAQVPDYSGSLSGAGDNWGGNNGLGVAYSPTPSDSGFQSGLDLTPNSGLELVGDLPGASGGFLAGGSGGAFAQGQGAGDLGVSPDLAGYLPQNQPYSALPTEGDASSLTNPFTGQASIGSDFFASLLTNLWNFGMRGALILLGIVLIAVGGYWLSAQAAR